MQPDEIFAHGVGVKLDAPIPEPASQAELSVDWREAAYHWMREYDEVMEIAGRQEDRIQCLEREARLDRRATGLALALLCAALWVVSR